MKMLRCVLKCVPACIAGLLVFALAVQAQFPIPRIPGQTGPAGPNGRPRTQPAPQPDSRGKRPSADSKGLLTTTAGILRRAAPNQLVIQSDDHRVIWYRLAPQMKVTKDTKDATLAEFALGDYLRVESSSDDDSVMTAVSVSWEKAGTSEDRAEAAKDWDLPRLETGARSSARPTSTSSASSPPREAGDERPVMRRKNPEPEPEAPKEAEAVAVPPEQEEPEVTRPVTVMRPPDPKPDPDDPGRPVVRRGIPAPRRQTVEPVETVTVESSTRAPAPTVVAPVAEAVIPVQDDPIIAKAREAAAAFSASLPNYMVQQMTTRYQSDRPKAGWRALDIVTADVTYQDGQESYKNIKVGNKSVNTSMDQIEGSRSTGEFSTLLEQILGRYSAKFRAGRSDTIRNRSAYVYSFEVPRELARWRIEAPSQIYYPALRGSIWIDKETSRVLRIEQQGRPMPALFPFDTVETSADYDFIRLGTAGPFLLPVEAEVLSCQRGSGLCSRNKIEFRNYRKFGAESDIRFDQPQ